MNQQQKRITQTERSALSQLPGDLFGFDTKAIDRASSFGLVPMQEGWTAGGVIAKLALSRCGLHGKGPTVRCARSFPMAALP